MVSFVLDVPCHAVRRDLVGVGEEQEQQVPSVQGPRECQLFKVVFFSLPDSVDSVQASGGSNAVKMAQVRVLAPCVRCLTAYDGLLTVPSPSGTAHAPHHPGRSRPRRDAAVESAASQSRLEWSCEHARKLTER